MALGDALARRIKRSPVGRALAARLAFAYIRLVTRTTRWDVRGRDRFHGALDADGRGAIAVMWHGRLFMAGTYAPVRRRKVIAMISRNRDGDLIAGIVRRFGVVSVRGSTHDRAKRRGKGGARAYDGAARGLLEDGAVVAITPDGPRGPRMRAQAGTAQLAIETGRPVIPIAFSVRRGAVLKSWDRFLLPWPFNRGAIIFGEWLAPPKDPSPEARRAFHTAVETALTEATNLADDLCGRNRIAPDHVRRGVGGAAR